MGQIAVLGLLGQKVGYTGMTFCHEVLGQLESIQWRDFQCLRDAAAGYLMNLGVGFGLQDVFFGYAGFGGLDQIR